MAELIFDAVLLVVFLAILVRSAIFAIESIVKVTKITGISELSAGFVILAVSTSMPEISVASFSVVSQNVGITLGDIFGSNVTNIAFIAALFLLISPLKRIKTETVKRFSPILLAASLIPLLLLLAEEGSRFIGIALLGVFAYFVYHTFKSRPEEAEEPKESGPLYKYLLFFLIGITIVIVSAKFVVDSASSIAESTGIRQSVIGATMIALGTSLPELTVDIVAVRRKHLDLALGDIIGSCLANITLVLGIVLVFSKLEIRFSILSTLLTFAIIAPLALFLLVRNGRISAWQSVILFAIYAIFLIVIYEVQLMIGGISFGSLR
jgi:cation:H+ antiporter